MLRNLGLSKRPGETKELGTHSKPICLAFVRRSFLPASLPLFRIIPKTLPGALDKERSKSWVLFKRLYRQVNREINAGTKYERSAEGTEEEPEVCRAKPGKVHRGSRTLGPSSRTHPWQRKARSTFPQSQPCLAGWRLFLATLMTGRKKYLKYTTL